MIKSVWVSRLAFKGINSLRVCSQVLSLQRVYCFFTVKNSRAFSEEPTKMTTALLLGLFEDDQTDAKCCLTKYCQHYDSANANKLSTLVQKSGLLKKNCGKTRIFYDVDSAHTAVAVTNIGKKDQTYDSIEDIDMGKEAVRLAISGGLRQLHDAGIHTVVVDPCEQPCAAAEAAHLTNYFFDDLKCDDNKKARLTLSCYTPDAADKDKTLAEWNRGVVMAEAQNLARWLMENPANIMTPTRFGEVAVEKIGSLPKCKVDVWPKSWAEEKKMGAFLGVAQGSHEPPKFVEITYSGGKAGDKPVALVGKGITFDSGGTSIKPAAHMDSMRGDMGGAANVVAAIYAAAKLALPINIKGFTPMTENMPGGGATKPGDVHTAMNGKTIQVDNTDAEGRLVLADALCYAQTFDPCCIIDLATLTGAILIALGNAATGAYTNSENMWKAMHEAGQVTGDRMWRMPLFKAYSNCMTDCLLADVNNIGSGGRDAGSCTAAAFLKEFVESDRKWMHMDIAGVANMMPSMKSEAAYSCKGMSGRPVRTLVEYLDNCSKNPNCC